MSNSLKTWRGVLFFSLLMLCLFGSAPIMAQQWIPPDDPDPEDIRDEADIDIEQGRLSLAAEKYLWYHHNALKYKPSLGGVRLSYALGDWRELADKYPPALQDIRSVRDRAEESVRRNENDFSAFLDFVALNDVLRNDGRTIELFKWLDQNKRRFARTVFAVAQDALVAGSEYELCEKYIVGRNAFDFVIEDHEDTVRRFKELYRDEPDAEIFETFDMMFARRSSFIIAILVNRERQSEAEIIAERALALLEDGTHRVQISDALEGIPPERLR
jgi:hypothetical protein